MIPPPSKSELVRWFLEAAKDYRRPRLGLHPEHELRDPAPVEA